MSIFENERDLLPGLMPAAFRGVQFYVVDASQEVGRRIVTNYFPGLDNWTHEDLGILDGPIDLKGFVIGDDYIAQARALQRAFQTPGPGTLLHPWLGELTVVLSDPARIDFKVTELRVARLQATFERTAQPGISSLSTLPRLLAALTGVTAAAQGLVAGILGARLLPMIHWSSARSVAAAVLDLTSAEVGASRASSVLVPAFAAAMTKVAAVDTMPVDTAAATYLAEQLTTLPEPVVSYASPAMARAIGLGGKVLPAPAMVLDARSGTALVLRMARKIGIIETTLPAEKAVTLLSDASMVTAAGRLIADIDFESRQEAIRWRDDLDSALQRLSAGASVLATENVALGSQLWHAAQAARAALAADMSTAIGRLPSVRTIVPPTAVSAFLLAQHLVGDDPRQVVPMVDDITRRNRLRHPGSVPPEPIEVLA